MPSTKNQPKTKKKKPDAFHLRTVKFNKVQVPSPKMNKNCARCNKVVYPIEELKCLDKVCVVFLLCRHFVLSCFHYYLLTCSITIRKVNEFYVKIIPDRPFRFDVNPECVGIVRKT